MRLEQGLHQGFRGRIARTWRFTLQAQTPFLTTALEGSPSRRKALPSETEWSCAVVSSEPCRLPSLWEAAMPERERHSGHSLPVREERHGDRPEIFPVTSTSRSGRMTLVRALLSSCMKSRGLGNIPPSSVMNHRCRLQNPEGEGFRDVKGDARLRMLLVAYGQILSKNQFQIPATLGNHVGFVFIGAAEIGGLRRTEPPRTFSACILTGYPWTWADMLLQILGPTTKA